MTTSNIGSTRRKKAVALWLTPPVVLLVCWLSVILLPKTEDGSWAQHAVGLMFIFTLIAGWVLVIPCLIYGLVLWFKKPIIGQLPPSGDDGFHEVPVRVSDTRFKAFLAALPFGFLSKTATYPAVLAWSNGLNEIRLERISGDNSKQTIFTANYSQLQHAYLFANLIKLTHQGRVYEMMPRSGVSDAVYTAGVATRSSAGGAIAAETAILQASGIGELYQRLADAGVPIYIPRVGRAIWLGVLISLGLLGALFIVLFVMLTINPGR